MAGEQKYTVDIGVTGLSSLNKLQTNIDGLQRKMMGLKTLIASGLFAGLGAGALQMADDLQDLANATGIATGRLLELKKALTDNGGAADQMAQGVTTFVRSIDEAAQGSLKAQNTFRELGVTMTDLQTLGEQELMVKALKGIGGITDASRRASIMMDLFGKSFRTVDAKGLADDLEKSAGSADKYAAALKRGAELNDALATASGNVKLAFLEAFAPIIKSLNEFNTATSEGTARMDLLIAGIKIAGAALVTAFSVGIFLPLVTAVGTLGRGIGVVAGALGSAGIATWAASAFRALGPLMSGLRVIALLFSAGLGIYTASKLFDDFGSIALNVLSRVTEGILDMAASLLNLPTDAIAALLNLFGANIKDPKGLGTPFLMAKDALEALRKKQEESAAANKKLQEETKKTSEATKEQADAIKRVVDTSAYDNAVKGIQKVGEAYSENGRRILENIELETLSIGNSKQANELEAARVALSNRSYDAVKQLREAQASMSKEMKEAGLGKYYEDEIAKIEKLAFAEGDRLENLVTNLHKAKAAEDLRLFGIKESNQAFDDILKIEKELSMIGYSDQAKSILDVAYAADERARAEIRSLEASRGVKLNEEEVSKIFSTSRSQVQALADATNKLAEAREKFAQNEGLRLFSLKAEYDLQDKLLTLQREIADIGLTDIEKKYRDITRAADDSAKAAIRAEEDRRSAVAGTRVYLNPDEIADYYNRARLGSEEVLKTQKKLYDSSRTFSAGWKSAFSGYIDNATNAAKSAERVFEKFTAGIEDLLVDFAKTGKFEWKSFVNSMLEELLRSQIKQTLASVLQMSNPFGSGNVSDMFGGLFGGLLGDSGASKGQSANNPMYVYDVSSGSGGPLGGLMGPQQSGQDGGIMGTIGNIFSGIKNSVGNVFSGIGGAISGIAGSIGSIFSGGGGGGGGGFFDTITSGLGDLFGGFFANGGNIPAGKFGMVGERGPELIGGPASITPMGGSTNVTYNIQAVDARSFQQLLASDPSFIFALTEQGRKSIPGTRR